MFPEVLGEPNVEDDDPPPGLKPDIGLEEPEEVVLPPKGLLDVLGEPNDEDEDPPPGLKLDIGFAVAADEESDFFFPPPNIFLKGFLLPFLSD